MHRLIKECVEGNGEAWSELWMLYDHFAAPPVRRLLERAGFGPMEADEVATGVFWRLWRNKCRRLKTFRGTTDAELHNWIVRVAINLTRDHIRRFWRAKKRERAARKVLRQPERDGPNEQDIEAVVADREPLLAKEEAVRLRVLAGVDDAPDESANPVTRSAPESARTRRRRDKALYDKVRKYLQDWRNSPSDSRRRTAD